MATALKTDKALEELERTLIAEANQNVDSRATERLFALPFTLKRAQHDLIQRCYFVLNRRDCWGFVQGNAPMDIKKLVWEHEQDELTGIKDQSGLDHVTLNYKEGEALGLTPDDFRNTPPTPGTETCLRAWRNLAQEGPWLQAFAASSALEMTNSEALLKNGSMSGRMARKLNRELGIPLKKLASKTEHMAVDVGHALLLMEVARRHGTTPEARQQILNGARRTWAIQTTWFTMLGDSLAAIDG